MRSKGINVIILVKMFLNHAKLPKQCYQKRAKRHKKCAHEVAERTKSLPNNSYPAKSTQKRKI